MRADWDARFVGLCDFDELGFDGLHGVVDSEFDLVRVAAAM